MKGPELPVEKNRIFSAYNTTHECLQKIEPNRSCRLAGYTQHKKGILREKMKLLKIFFSPILKKKNVAFLACYEKKDFLKGGGKE